MNVEEIKACYESALKVFLEKELYLLENDVSERAMAHKLAEYIREQFRTFDVDCEYNRNGSKPKIIQFEFNKALNSEVEKLVERAHEWQARLQNNENEYADNDDLPPITFSTFPDIIVHTRGENYPTNLLVVEIKKERAGDEDVRFDHAKLTAFTSDEEDNPYRYQLGVHLTISGTNGASLYFRKGASA